MDSFDSLGLSLASFEVFTSAFSLVFVHTRSFSFLDEVLYTGMSLAGEAASFSISSPESFSSMMFTSFRVRFASGSGTTISSPCSVDFSPS